MVVRHGGGFLWMEFCHHPSSVLHCKALVSVGSMSLYLDQNQRYLLCHNRSVKSLSPRQSFYSFHYQLYTAKCEHLERQRKTKTVIICVNCTLWCISVLKVCIVLMSHVRLSVNLYWSLYWTIIRITDESKGGLMWLFNIKRKILKTRGKDYSSPDVSWYISRL